MPIYLKITGVDGESTAQGHEGAIDVLSFAWGLENTASPGGGGSGAGRASPRDLVFTAYTSKASPTLFVDCATGKHHPSASLSVTQDGERSGTYLQIALADVLVTAYSISDGDGTDRPLDEVALDFARMTWNYSVQRPDGSLDPVPPVGYDFRTRRRI